MRGYLLRFVYMQSSTAIRVAHTSGFMRGRGRAQRDAPRFVTKTGSAIGNEY